MNENIIQSPIVQEVEQSFLNYSLSVITDRAIPAVEDGFKPVQRRILYEMYEDGYKSSKPYVKCANVVGRTMAAYHPHGDSSIYGALTIMSQPWSMRYPLIDWHGNRGSRDGDEPAAYRYTECRLAKIAEATLANIKKDTVDWVDNYAETTKEPVYLPGMFPHLLCNGTTGIAVAVACSFAPHNLGEVMNAAIAYLQGKASTSVDLLNYIKGPDFPTGGIVINQKELQNAYITGKGRARIRGEYNIEKMRNGADRIVFTSIPYRVSKESLITDIDNLCEEKKIVGISEIRDESNKDGVRFVIELAKGIDSTKIINELYYLTDLETTYSYNQVALVNKTPKQMTLIDIIQNYIDHQKEVYRRLNEYELRILEERIHILDGLCTALDDIDNVIAIIKASENKNVAQLNLIKKYNFSDAQAEAILSMTLSRLANMEKIAVQQEREDKNKQKAIIITRLNDDKVFTNDLTNLLIDFKNQFADKRRTTITNIEPVKSEKVVEKIIPEDVIVTIKETGDIKRIPVKNFKVQRRNTKGLKSQNDHMLNIVNTNTTDVIMIFTDRGRVYRLPVNNIPENVETSINALIQLEPNEKVSTITSASCDKADEYVWFITKNGLIKKSSINEYTSLGQKKTGTQAINIREGDALCSVWIGNNTDVIVITKEGMSIRFTGESVSPSGRVASGVQAIKLNEQDLCVFGGAIKKDDKILIGCTDGTGKLLQSSEFVRQGRAGKGAKINKTGKISAVVIGDYDKVYIAGSLSNLYINVSDISVGTRLSAPVKLIKDSNIVSITGV